MRTIQYPIFLASRDCTQDPFWKQLFEKLAYGEPPKGTFFEKDTLCSTLKKREFVYPFGGKEAEQIYDELYYILTSVFAISKGEVSVSKKQEFERFTSSLRRCEENWSAIKQKNVRESLILIFISRAMKQFSLSVEQAQDLQYFIHIGLLLKIFQDKDIIIKDGMIQAIDGIEFEERNFKITRPFQIAEGKPESKITKPKVINPKDLWAEYLYKNGGQ